MGERGGKRNRESPTDEALGPEKLLDAVAKMTDGHGADVVIVTASTKANGPIELAAEVARRKGRVVIVGAVGMDLPRPLGRGAFGGTMCGPVFSKFMNKAVEIYGSGKFKVPEESVFVKIDRYSGERLPDGASGKNAVAELFRVGEEPVFGALSIIDGGFAMGSNLPMFAQDESDPLESGDEVVTQLGVKKKIPKRATFGSLSSGGLY